MFKFKTTALNSLRDRIFFLQIYKLHKVHTLNRFDLILIDQIFSCVGLDHVTYPFRLNVDSIVA